MVFAELTVDENLRIGASGRKGGASQEVMEQIYGLFPQIERRRNDQAGWLSGGEQQMVAIGRGLMATPRLLLLDEVSLGLAPLITRAIFEQLREVRSDSGTSMLVVEQNARAGARVLRLRLRARERANRARGPGRRAARGPADPGLYLGGAVHESERSFAAAKRYRRRRRWLA